MTDKPRSDQLASDEWEDGTLLRRYAKTGDAEAFQILVARYQFLVWSACRRVLGNSHDAEDAVQKVFLALAKSAASIRSNLAAWLHATAVNRSTSVVRSTVARRRREQQHADNCVTVEDERAWNEIRDVIDVCLAELRDDERELIIQHFYCGTSQQEIGARLGIGQQAVGVQLKKVIEQLRRALRRRGLPVTAVALAGSLKAGLAEASAPASLQVALTKIGVAGFGYSSFAAVTALSYLTKGALAVVAAMLCGLAAWLTWGPSRVRTDAVLAQLDAARSIQYTRTRINSLKAQTELIGPNEVLDASTERYFVLGGYQERVEELDPGGTVRRAMIANYRTGRIVWLDLRAKTYMTNLRLARQRNAGPGANQPDARKLAPQTELADSLARFSADAVEALAAQTLDGRDAVGLAAETTQGNNIWKCELWVDRETLRPLRTTVTWRNDQPTGGASDWITDNFVFDADLSRSLFSTEPPAGFRLKNITPPAGGETVSGIPLP
jgi:RNA polymerase sigma factor (sigma-70 family)